MEIQTKSHKEWRKNAKKFQRKRRRRLAAIKRDEALKQNEESPTYQTKLAEEHALELIQLQNIERINEIEHEKWMKSEWRIEKEWQIQKSKLEEQARRKEEERQRIQAEFEAEQKQIAEAKQEKEQRIEEEKQRQIDLEMRIQAYVEGVGDQPPELLVNAETNPGKEPCQYFAKMASCRFGNNCIWNHQRSNISKVLHIQSFFSNIHLEQSTTTEYGNDLTLEYDETELNENFREFFIDVVQEFEHFGCIRYFVVSTNYNPHLRGQVFVEYTSERNALKAQRKMNGRYYAGRMLNVEFCTVLWEKAVCGSWLKDRCVRGQNCGFYHIFKNPDGRYSIEETLLEHKNALKSQRNGSVRNEEKDNWNNGGEHSKANWRWSESPIREVIVKNVTQLKTEQRRSRARSRSRSSSRHKGRKRSKHRDRSRSHSKKRSRRYSRSRDRDEDRQRDRDRNSRHKSKKERRKD
ncbi:U2 small nuclear ribonucleoprotein auxiliary factor 35 kDa subunit-related protein 2 [Sitodiplosis mosellana]|uniref:U2 small nuclear ribonucleoprotein auxiliary factor 35 kDa subunit-related protein 2 n=1 Tax=Sitodiplosis mosellana TaxID=263140 RepID=UPI002444762F|nr:U2 small nuclear ribonucleoprotein auxiliary factor 35 kDa subunit-related protein 2 [Sitodiplosis mosellana]